MALKRVTTGRAIILKQTIKGLPGDRGEPGKDAVATVVHKTVHVVEEGKPGQKGDSPDHQVRSGEIRFMKPDGTWGKWIEVQPAQQANGGGGLESIKYTSVEQAAFRVTRKALIVGTNIFGVNFSGAVEFILPSGIDKNIIIVIKDESNDASTNNITITTENP